MNIGDVAISPRVGVDIYNDHSFVGADWDQTFLTPPGARVSAENYWGDMSNLVQDLVAENPYGFTCEITRLR